MKRYLLQLGDDLYYLMNEVRSEREENIADFIRDAIRKKIRAHYQDESKPNNHQSAPIRFYSRP